MLRHSFIHLPGIGPQSERRLWRAGILDWAAYQAARADGRMGSGRLDLADAELARSIERYAVGDWNYFDRLLPADQKWRVYGDCRDRALCLDIETTGTADADPITVIGTYNGSEVRQFVNGRDLDAAREYIEQYPLVVTYNGALFDLPLIGARFRYNFFNHVHVDLRFPLRRLGLKGGLKKIEAQLGIEREDSVRGLARARGGQ